VLGQR
jgi:hypothetical protein